MIGVAAGLGSRRWTSTDPDHGGGSLALMQAARRLDQRDRRVGPQPTLLPRMERAPGVPLCAGRPDEFDSTDPVVTEETRRVCIACPVRSWCAEEAARAVRAKIPIEGCWAGVIYAAGTALYGGSDG